MMEENESAILAALRADVGKPGFEAEFAEVVTVETEIRATLDEIDEWMKPKSYPTPAALLPGKSYVLHEPYGVVLIIAPFNYPIQLSILPLIAAISAGNCAILKPSEQTPASSELLGKLFAKYLDPQAFQIVTGDKEQVSALLKERWDYIFFTGSEFVGKVVAKAAAEHLTPITLELGGKSPVILGEDADLTLAARRVMWGKCMNAGQSCIAPDYVFVPTKLKKQFVDACVSTVKGFYAGNPESNPDFGRIVNESTTQRLGEIIDRSKGSILHGGKYDVSNKYVEPTIVDAKLDSPAMEKEIFGPILVRKHMHEEMGPADEVLCQLGRTNQVCLFCFGPFQPIITYDDVSKVIEYINSKPKPLSLYVFSTNDSFTDRILNQTSSGGVSVNDVMMHFANASLPFGGVGTSGIGAYHGKWGFETFSHAKAVLKKSIYGDAPARYPPYTAFNAKLFRFVAELYKVNSTTFSKLFKFVVLPLIVAALAHRAGLTIGFKSNL
jgi:aldehyde dehydrogenase (NAD+)